MQYCLSTQKTKRFSTREMDVGGLKIGANHPIRIQSMTTTPTQDVDATAAQIITLYDAGCELVRVTVQGKKEAQSCEAIRSKLIQKGYSIPLIADIHFYPPAALLVCDFVDKVRINPGNFADRRAIFKVQEYDEISYAKELERIEEIFTPLVQKCKRLKKALRIGANHGSLSDRIMNRFGDSPKGMVLSAIEYAEVCRKNDFHNFCFSMKSSNPIVMIEAYRLLVAEMMKRGWDYPLHLGVTEAGAEEEGRIKSAMGIGALLSDGIGDTIRVSLTEDPIYEIPVCKELVAFANKSAQKSPPPFEETRDFQNLQKREVFYPNPLHEQGSVVVKRQNKLFIENQEVEPKEWILFSPQVSPVHETRAFVEKLKQEGSTKPLILDCPKGSKVEMAAHLGSILCDRLVEGIAVEDEDFGLKVLQAARMRMTKTDFISCPSCGRTLFDLQEVSSRIRKKTAHLPGVKIAIMGCIVNGPGEMADADFGYVGSKPGKIDLYVGKECVEKNIDFDEADTKLIELIQSKGKWVEQEESDAL